MKNSLFAKMQKNVYGFWEQEIIELVLLITCSKKKSNYFTKLQIIVFK